MFRSFVLIVFISLLACSPKDKIEVKSESLESKNYTACAVLQDFLVERRATFEKPKTIVTDYDLEVFHYIDPTPIWIGKRTSHEERTADTSRQELARLKPHIDSRIDVIIQDNTYSAYAAAQEELFEPAKCILPSYIYNKNDGLEIIEARVEHNKVLRFNSVKAQSDYREEKRKLKEKYDKGKSAVIRKEFYKKRQPYMLRKFSRIGINQEDNQAFFYTEYYCGMLCAEGTYVLMELKNGKWKVTARYMAWIS